VRDDLEGLVNAGLRQLVMSRARLAERVARVPDDIVDRRAAVLGGNEIVDDGAPGACRPDSARSR
jgi:hypothetical protein